MDGKYYYEQANDQLNLKDKKEYLGRLTPEQRKLYDKYYNKKRQEEHRKKVKQEDPEKHEEIKKMKAEYKAELRKAEPTKYKELNKRDVKNHRARNKAKEEEILAKVRKNAVHTLTDAIKARKARQELNKLNEKKAKKDIAKDILNDIIDTIPKKAKLKKNNEALKRHRAKKAEGVETKQYNTRGRKKEDNK